MSSFRDKRNKRKTTFFLVVSSIIAALLVWGCVRFIVRRSRSHIPVLAPATVYTTLESKKTLVQKIVEQQTTLESYGASLATLTLLQDENEKLKAELGRPQTARGILAHVVTLPNRSIYSTFSIDAGTAEGVLVGQTVYAFNSVALGMVSDTTDHSATVLLFSAGGNTTSGTVQGSDVAVSLIGRGAGEYEVRMPRDVHFDIGSVVAYQSTQTAVLATIERIATDPRDPFQKLYAKVPINLQALKWVIVR